MVNIELIEFLAVCVTAVVCMLIFASIQKHDSEVRELAKGERLEAKLHAEQMSMGIENRAWSQGFSNQNEDGGIGQIMSLLSNPAVQNILQNMKKSGGGDIAEKK